MEEDKIKLIHGSWYKFKPYSQSPFAVWYMKCDDPSRANALCYIGWDQSDKTGKLRKFTPQVGHFGNSYSYHEVTPKELLWLKKVEEECSFFPFEEMKFEEVINNYSIY